MDRAGKKGPMYVFEDWISKDTMGLFCNLTARTYRCVVDKKAKVTLSLWMCLILTFLTFSHDIRMPQQ